MFRFRQQGVLAFVTCAALSAGAAYGGVLYDNTTASSGNLHGATISPILSRISDSFVLAANSDIGGVTFRSWRNQISGIDWQISSAPYGSGSSGTVFGSGTATVTSTEICSLCGPVGSQYQQWDNQFTIPSLSLTAGTYFLMLHSATAGGNGLAYWDMSNGPSSAYIGASFFGPLNIGTANYFSVAGSESQTFQILDTAGSGTPEPATLLTTFSAGLLIALRRRSIRRVFTR